VKPRVLAGAHDRADHGVWGMSAFMRIGVAGAAVHEPVRTGANVSLVQIMEQAA
jgi:hypothetical protein